MNTSQGYGKKLKRDGTLQYSLQWPGYMKVDKFTIVRKMSKMPGIFIIFYINEYKRLTPLVLGLAWYNGLKSSLIKYFEDMHNRHIPKYILEKVEEEDVYIKFMEIYSLEDITNIYFKLKDKYKKAFLDTNGIVSPDEKVLRNIKIVDKGTKMHFKKEKELDI